MEGLHFRLRRSIAHSPAPEFAGELRLPSQTLRPRSPKSLLVYLRTGAFTRTHCQVTWIVHKGLP